ncbi:MAG: class I SAM-dependent methyltransferase [Burkholderiales bacterium]
MTNAVDFAADDPIGAALRSVSSMFTPRPLDARMVELLAGYPPEACSEKLHYSIELIARYTEELAVDILQRLGAARELDNWRSGDELNRALAFEPQFADALVWLLHQAAEVGRIEAQSVGGGGPRYRRLSEPDDSRLASLRAAGLAIDPANEPTLTLLERVAALYPGLARGEVSADQVLFDLQHIELWLSYFNNANPAYAVNNWVAALAAVPRLDGNAKFRILEIGAGAGSASDILLGLLHQRGLAAQLERYVISEPSPFFRRRGERQLKRRFAGLSLEFVALDIDRPWSEQGFAAGEFDLVFGVNVMHVAKDLAFSLGEAGAALRASGWLVLGECLRAAKPIFPELIFQTLASFRDVQTDPQFRPRPGFLSAAHWRLALAHARFTGIELTPAPERLLEICPNFLASAVSGQKPPI